MTTDEFWSQTKIRCTQFLTPFQISSSNTKLLRSDSMIKLSYLNGGIDWNATFKELNRETNQILFCKFSWYGLSNVFSNTSLQRKREFILIYFYFYVWYFWSINRWALEELLSNFILDIWIEIKLKYSPSSNRCWLSDDVQLLQKPAKENKIWDRCWIAGELAQTGLSVQNELIYRIKLAIRFDYTQWWLN